MRDTCPYTHMSLQWVNGTLVPTDNKFFFVPMTLILKVDKFGHLSQNPYVPEISIWVTFHFRQCELSDSKILQPTFTSTTTKPIILNLKQAKFLVCMYLCMYICTKSPCYRYGAFGTITPNLPQVLDRGLLSGPKI